MTGNFPGSLPDEVEGSTSLLRSVCFLFHLWSHRNAQASERQTETEEEQRWEIKDGKQSTARVKLQFTEGWEGGGTANEEEK